MISSVLTGIALTVPSFASATSDGAAQSSCPRVSVSCIGTNGCEPPYFFLASVANTYPRQKISYEWAVANGRIVGGQGTPVIKVVRNRVTKTFNRDGKLVSEFRNQGALTATVKLVGAPAECDRQVVASMSLLSEEGLVPPPKLIEEFGNISFKDVKPRLDSFVYQLRNQPGAMGYIVSEGNWRYAKRAIDYLVATKGIDFRHLKYVPKTTTNRFVVKLYIVPTGSVPPS